jgi:hypothetical protein
MTHNLNKMLRIESENDVILTTATYIRRKYHLKKGFARKHVKVRRTKYPE